MSRRPSPWFRKDRNAGFVKIDGRQLLIVEHPAGSPKPKKSDITGQWNAPDEVREAFSKLTASPVMSGTVWEIFDSFLGWTEANRAPRTYEFYQERLQRFKDAQRNMPVERLTPEHVYQWLNDKTWSDTYKRGCMTTLCRAFNWALHYGNRTARHCPEIPLPPGRKV